MTIAEIAPDVFRLSLFAPKLKLQFNHCPVRDEESRLFQSGMRRLTATWT